MPQRFEQGLYHISEDLIWLLLKLKLNCGCNGGLRLLGKSLSLGGALILRQVTVYVAKVVIRDA